MKKFALLLILSVAAVITVCAQEWRGAFVRGKVLHNVNFGMKVLVLPHFGLSDEWCVASGFYKSGRGSLGVGLYAGAGFPKVGLPSMVSICSRVTLHNHLGRRVDFYIGMLNGLNMLNVLQESLDQARGTAGTTLGFKEGWNPYYGFDFYMGWRWAFTENFGMNLELAPLPWPLFSQPVVSVGISWMTGTSRAKKSQPEV